MKYLNLQDWSFIFEVTGLFLAIFDFTDTREKLEEWFDQFRNILIVPIEHFIIGFAWLVDLLGNKGAMNSVSYFVKTHRSFTIFWVSVFSIVGMFVVILREQAQGQLALSSYWQLVYALPPFSWALVMPLLFASLGVAFIIFWILDKLGKGNSVGSFGLTLASFGLFFSFLARC